MITEQKMSSYCQLNTIRFLTRDYQLYGFVFILFGLFKSSAHIQVKECTFICILQLKHNRRVYMYTVYVFVFLGRATHIVYSICV